MFFLEEVLTFSQCLCFLNLSNSVSNCCILCPTTSPELSPVWQICSTKTGSFIPELSGWSFPGCRVEITYCTVVLNACFNFTNFSNWLSFCRGVKLTALRLVTEKKREEKKNMSRLKSKRKSIHALWSLCPRLPMKLITAGKRRAKKTLCFCVDFWDYCISFPQASVPISSTSHKLQIIIYTFPATKKKESKGNYEAERSECLGFDRADARTGTGGVFR